MLAGSGAGGGGRFRSALSSASGSGAESAEEDEDEIEHLEGPTQPLAAVSHLVDLVGTRSSGDSDEASSSSDREELTAASAAAAIAPPATRPTAARATGADSAEDESDGFEEISASVAKRRSLKRPRVEDAAAAAALLKPQPTECTVCYDPCTIAGRHRLVSLKCGHLFGKKCIERWVAERKTCPNCNTVVRRADIRVLFSDHVAVVDNSGVEDALQKWEAEKSLRIQAETELSRVKLQLQLTKADAARHETETIKWKNEFTRLQHKVASQHYGPEAPSKSSLGKSPERPIKTEVVANTPFSPTLSSSSKMPRSPVKSLSTTVPPTPRAQEAYTEVFRYQLVNSRVFDISCMFSVLCIGESFGSNTHGVLKLSAADPRHAARIPVHQSPVRDIAISSQGDLAMTIAFDGKAAITNLASQSVVLQIPLPPSRRQGWSCALSASDPFAMYCGFHDGTVLKYDMRRPGSGPNASYSLQDRQPVHSIKLLTNPVGGETLVAATFSGFSLWSDPSRLEQSNTAYATVPSCCSLVTPRTRSGNVVVSTRTQAGLPAKHSLFDLQSRSTGQLTPTAVMSGYRTPAALTRSATWHDGADNTFVASGDDDSHRLLVWNVNTRQVVQRLYEPSPGTGSSPMIVDVQHSSCGAGGNRKALLGVLRPKEIALFSCR